jgi:N-methylhydantoinase A
VLLGVDVGGTFTDAVLVGEDSAVFSAKVASTPEEQSVGVLASVRLVLERAGAHPGDVELFAHGMTVATNALLEGRVARTALIATEGFTDVLELARQARPSLYELCRSPPPPLVPDELRFGANERTGPEGVQRALEPQAAAELVREIARARPEAVAVALLHSYAHPEHERMLAGLIAQLIDGAHVSCSCELVGTYREYERTATTAIDAALSPLLASYLRSLSEQSRAAGLPEAKVMQSSGGLTESARAGAHAALTVLSGPAGGAGAALLLAELGGDRDVLCFDMGGTSCDVCVIAGGQIAETAERTIAGRPLSLPALDIHTVGAGGGSIAWRDAGGALRVGPASAGAVPGPACYGRGGLKPTVTDANLLLGRLLSDAPLAGELALDRAAAEAVVGALARELEMDTLACAEGIVRVAEAEMLAALRLVTVERGLDPRAFVLMPFGGAGPLHAAAMATELGIERVLCPRASGVLSALGLAAAAPRRDVSRTVMLAGAALTAERLQAERDTLIQQASAELGTSPARIRLRHELRYHGQSFELSVEQAPGGSPEELLRAFAGAHEERYGYREDAAEVELVNIRVSAWGPAPRLRLHGPAGPPPEPARTEIVFDGVPREASVLRGEPGRETRMHGPALCAQPEATLLVPPGWSLAVDEHGSCHLSPLR